MPRLPRYYRPPKKKMCLGLNDEAKEYIKSQAMLWDVTMTFWLNMFLVHTSRKGRDFDPRPFKPTEAELKALAISGLSARDIARYKVTGFGSVRRPNMPKKRSKQGKF